MDGRGRLAQPLKRSKTPRASGGGRRHTDRNGRSLRSRFASISHFVVGFDRRLQRASGIVAACMPRHAGLVGAALLCFASAGYGVVKGGHVPAIANALVNARDTAANAVGFGIVSVTIGGCEQLSEAEVLAAAGITPRTSLLFLQAEATRQRLEGSPWIAQAAVRKLYPGRLEITVQERQAFALWQLDRKLFLVAHDGTVLGELGQRRSPALPLVVGPGAAAKASAFLAVVDGYPALRGQMRAAVLVAERRWNLKLKSGLDVRLPEEGIGQALDRLLALDRDKRLLSRDITAIDLRLPDRITVRLSDEAAQAREEAAREKNKKKRKGGNA